MKKNKEINKNDVTRIQKLCKSHLPPNFIICELHQHDVPQKNTFFKENSDSEEKSIVL